jgi:hypothetical protein
LGHSTACCPAWIGWLHFGQVAPAHLDSAVVCRAVIRAGRGVPESLVDAMMRVLLLRLRWMSSSKVRDVEAVEPG